MHDGSLQSATPAQHTVVPASPALLHDAFIYAGFWRRFAALFWDNVVLSGIFLVILIPLLLYSEGTFADETTQKNASEILINIFYLVVSACYFSIMESGSQSASYGKRWVGIQVLDTAGNRISRKKALGQWLSHFLSGITLCIGYLIQPFTKRKQALHDMVCATILVVNKNARPSSVLFTHIGVAIPVALISFAIVMTILEKRGYLNL